MMIALSVAFLDVNLPGVDFEFWPRLRDLFSFTDATSKDGLRSCAHKEVANAAKRGNKNAANTKCEGLSVMVLIAVDRASAQRLGGNP
jgi:hypothetical protein